MSIKARFLSLARSKLRLCSANHRAGYFSNLACDWLSLLWARHRKGAQITDIVGASDIQNQGHRPSNLLALWKILVVYHLDYCSQRWSRSKKGGHPVP